LAKVMLEVGLQEDVMPLDQGIGQELPDAAIR